MQKSLLAFGAFLVIGIISVAQPSLAAGRCQVDDVTCDAPVRNGVLSCVTCTATDPSSNNDPKDTYTGQTCSTQLTDAELETKSRKRALAACLGQPVTCEANSAIIGNQVSTGSATSGSVATKFRTGQVSAVDGSIAVDNQACVSNKFNAGSNLDISN